MWKQALELSEIVSGEANSLVQLSVAGNLKRQFGEYLK